jgi:hypothetical protein
MVISHAGLAAIVNFRPDLSSEKATHIKKATIV